MPVTRSSLAATMQLLNDVASRFPQAISFAAGRPPDDFVALPHLETTLENCLAGCPGLTRSMLGQYSVTSGLILEILSEYLHRDGPGHFSPRNLLVTNGAQEAILISLAALVGRSQVVIATDPTYVGLTGPAEIFGYNVETLPDDEHFVDRVQERALRPPSIGLVYVIPDFANPTGHVMTIADRQRLVALADQYSFRILEDVAYRRYRYLGEPFPTLKSLDSSGRVIYVESFAKTVLPGLRTAVMIVDGCTEEGTPLYDRLTAIKSYISVTTSPIAQALLAGILVQSNCQLRDAIEPRRAHVGTNRLKILRAIEQCFGSEPGFAWTRPSGGFFLTIETPRAFSSEDLIACAERAGVIALPMNLFSLTGSRPNQLRLAFSNVSPRKIDPGIEALYCYLTGRM